MPRSFLGADFVVDNLPIDLVNLVQTSKVESTSCLYEMGLRGSSVLITEAADDDAWDVNEFAVKLQDTGSSDQLGLKLLELDEIRRDGTFVAALWVVAVVAAVARMDL